MNPFIKSEASIERNSFAFQPIMTTPIASGSSAANRRGTGISGSVLFPFDFSELHPLIPLRLEISIAAHKPLKSIELLVDTKHKDAVWAPSAEQKFWNANFNPPL